MTDLWLVLPLIFFTNFMSIFLAIMLMGAVDRRRKRKVVEFMMNEIGQKISTDMDFQEIIKGFQEQERREREGRGE